MKNLYLISEDEKNIYLSCDKETDMKMYVEGRDKLFNYLRISETDGNFAIDKEKYKEFDYFRVAYIKTINNKEVVLYRTNEINISFSNLEIKNTMEAVAIKSYKGISLSLIADEIYDKYSVYEKNDNEFKLILEGEIFQFTNSAFSLNKTYLVEAYKKDNEIYKLANKTKEFKIVIKDFKKKRKNLLSIIIPTLNGEDFLPRTVDSVLLSTFEDLNIILVNDGSQDKTLEVMRWYEKKYPFIKVIDKAWSGLSESRNIGFDQSDGKYIAFLDGDDLVHPNMYKLLFDHAKKYDADVAISKTYILEHEKDPAYVLNVDCKNNTYVKYDYEKMFLELRKNTFDNIFFTSACTKIVKREKAKLVRFPESNYYEDNAYTPTLYSYLNFFILVDKTYYIWDKRKRSTVGTYSSTYKTTKEVDILEEYVKAVSYSISNGNKERVESMVYHAVSLLNHYYDTIKERIDLRLKYSKLIHDNIGRDLIKNNKILAEDSDKFRDFFKDLV